jgi:FRG domain
MIEHVATDMVEFTHAIVAIARAYGDSRPWWRGHADYAWSLVPSLYRQWFASKEGTINSRFRMMAKPRHANCPTSDDAFSWLFLMPHDRLPTCLLDWSESPLVAVYFATRDDVGDDPDAALWALSPTGLNLQQLTREVRCMPSSRDLRQLSQEAFVATKNNPDCSILSVVTEPSDPRYMVQQSVFTIHGCGTSISDRPEADQSLARMRIPGKAKPAFRQVWALLGISRAVLFPDRENLAAELASLDFVLRAEHAAPADS